jgi:glycosyltransferase involved in cell wall biosynthesis
MACFGRPQRTKRSIECIVNQDINNWEAFIMGDGCPDFQNLINSGYLETIRQEQLEKGNIINYFNSEKQNGGCGYHLINHAIQNATGKYFIFFANDDVILSNHFSHYLSEIEIPYVESISDEHKSWQDSTNSKFINILSIQDMDLDFIYYIDSDTNIKNDFVK